MNISTGGYLEFLINIISHKIIVKLFKKKNYIKNDNEIYKLTQLFKLMCIENIIHFFVRFHWKCSIIQEEFGWKLVHGDVFRPPRKGMLLSVLLGSGVQVFCMTLVTLAFACLGFLSPANRGALMSCAMILYVLLGSPAGYTSARIYKSFGGEKWKSNVLLTSMLCSG